MPSPRYLSATLPKAIIQSCPERLPPGWWGEFQRKHQRLLFSFEGGIYDIRAWINFGVQDPYDSFLLERVRNERVEKSVLIFARGLLIGGAWSLWTGDVKSDVACFWRYAMPFFEPADRIALPR